jgi:hypothetical protein
MLGVKMNRRKIEEERRKIINLIRPSNRKRNCLVFYANETEGHAMKKFLAFRMLQKKEYEIYTECIFITGQRADLLAIKNGRAYVLEILESETIEKCMKKLESYPLFTGTFMVREINDINEIAKEL